MPRTRRTQVPISDTALEALQAYATATSSSVPQVAADFLEQAAPQLLELASALNKAKESPARALRETAEMLQRAAAEADQLVLDMAPEKGKKRKAS